ncbi:hypothetical protein niasHT_033115 [Heterodera trifolii]|uniref:RING-type domain-containing protein n=1 Tax=Heterodera trifolii TaxID=157864 RepID=A0ABD2IJY1_9BILA
MHVNFLLFLTTLLLMGECDGQKDSTNSGKVPTKTGKVPRISGKVPTNSGKVPTNSGKKPTQIILDTKKSAGQNTLKQSLAYAVFFIDKRGKIPLESTGGENENEPKAIKIELITIYKELQLDIEKEIKNWQKSDQKGKNGQKGKKENGQKEQRFLRFVARSLEIKWDANAFLGAQEEEEEDVLATSNSETKKFENSPKCLTMHFPRGLRREGYNGIKFHLISYIIFILDDANHRHHRRRRRKRMASPPMPSPNADPNQQDKINFWIIEGIYTIVPLLILIIIICCKCRSQGHYRARHAPFGTMPSQNAVVVATPTQIQSALAAFQTITSIPYEANANEEENSCAICLDPIENGTMVKPLPCKHIFHNKCIYSWIKQHITCPICRDALSMTNAVGVSSNGQANGAINGNGGGSAQGTAAAVANQQQEVVIDIPSRHNNGMANGPN